MWWFIFSEEVWFWFFMFLEKDRVNMIVLLLYGLVVIFSCGIYRYYLKKIKVLDYINYFYC